MPWDGALAGAASGRIWTTKRLPDRGVPAWCAALRRVFVIGLAAHAGSNLNVQPTCILAAEQPAAESATAIWKLESLTLKDGKNYHGFVQSEGPQLLEFVEILRPPGKPMFAVVRPVDPHQIANLTRLEPSAREQLLKQFAEFRHRARFDAGRMENIPLRAEQRGEDRWWIVSGDWFTLESRTDEVMTRRCSVRVEQIFRAYRQLLPPRLRAPAVLRLQVLGSMDDYRVLVERMGLSLETPAFYSPTQNLIVAGSDLDAFSRRLTQTRDENSQVRRQYEALRTEFPRRLQTLAQELQQRGLNPHAIEQELRLRTTNWQREYEATMTRLDRLQRQNDTKFADVTRQMFSRLYHEAFHAYVENFVYPQADRPLPRWLEEGLAQIFETGQLDGDTLRIDAPDRERLLRLQADLKRDRPLPLAEVLAAAPEAFLETHDSAASQRLYLYSWALAFDLAFRRNLLQNPALEPYVLSQEKLSPTARFSRLLGRPLSEYEKLWRQEMLELRPR